MTISDKLTLGVVWSACNVCVHGMVSLTSTFSTAGTPAARYRRYKQLAPVHALPVNDVVPCTVNGSVGQSLRAVRPRLGPSVDCEFPAMYQKRSTRAV